jgi:hypothetical protein
VASGQQIVRSSATLTAATAKLAAVQIGDSRGVVVTLGALIRLAVRARRMLSFLLSYRAAPAT